MSSPPARHGLGPGGWVLERLAARGEGEPAPSPAEAAELAAWSPSLAGLLPRRRVLDELLGTAHPDLAVSTSQQVGALEVLAPELSRAFGVDQRTPHHDFDVGTHLLRALAAMATLSDDLDLRLATAAGARRFLSRVGALDVAVDLLTLKEADEAGKRLPPEARPTPRRDRHGRLSRPRRG